MKEIKLKSTSVFAFDDDVIPSTLANGNPLLAGDQKKLIERETNIDLILAEAKKPFVWLKINRGINKGSIFRASTDDKDHAGWRFIVNEVTTPQPIRHLSSWDTYNKSKKYAYTRAPRYLRWYSFSGSTPIRMMDGTIYPGYMASGVDDSVSILLDYQGGEVYAFNEDVRPLTFFDRLDQEVNIGDLVVVAKLYGEGLDVGVVKGYADEIRVLVEACGDGEMLRIPLEENSTQKIMKMPMTLKDTALMMKLSGSR